MDDFFVVVVVPLKRSYTSVSHSAEPTSRRGQPGGSRLPSVAEGLLWPARTT